MNKQKEKIKEIILGYSSDCGFDMDGAVDELSGLMDSIRKETLREVEKQIKEDNFLDYLERE